MIREKTYDSLQDLFYEKFGSENMNLLWQLKEIIKHLPVKYILDVGGGMYVSKNICFPEGAETALIIDPDIQRLNSLKNKFNDKRLKILEEKIETADLKDTRFDLVYFIMSLLWIKNPETALRNVTSKLPAYIIISNPEFSSKQLKKIQSNFPDYKSELTELLEKYYSKDLDIDAIMASFNYYPLDVIHTTSWDPSPEHSFRSVLYTLEKCDRTPYDIAKFIIQVNSVCNCNCPSCYVDKTGEHMESSVFRKLIEEVNENEVISLRGGEPTMTENLLDDFILPALQKGIHVILESNGSFIGTPHYQDYLKALTRKNIEVRLSLDKQHLDLFNTKLRMTKIGYIARFIDDATRLNIKFGLFSLGMYREQIRKFLEEYSVESWLQYIQPITKYSDITELPIKGKFVDVDGNIHDHITGVGWIGMPDEASGAGVDQYSEQFSTGR